MARACVAAHMPKPIAIGRLHGARLHGRRRVQRSTTLRPTSKNARRPRTYSTQVLMAAAQPADAHRATALPIAARTSAVYSAHARNTCTSMRRCMRIRAAVAMRRFSRSSSCAAAARAAQPRKTCARV